MLLYFQKLRYNNQKEVLPMSELKELLLQFRTLTESLHILLSSNNIFSTDELDKILNMRQNLIDQIDDIPYSVNDDLKTILTEIRQIDQKCKELLQQQLSKLKINISTISHGKVALNAYRTIRPQTWGAFVDNKK